MKLWEITRQIEDLAEVVGDGEITGEMIAAYHGFTEKLEEKVDSIIAVLQGYKHRSAYLEEQAKKYRDALKANDNAERGLKEYLKFQITAHQAYLWTNLNAQKWEWSDGWKQMSR